MSANHHLLRSYPGRRLSAFDGMAVTAEVWQEAHEYHRYHQRLHALHNHGVGIVSGLEVIATDPPSQTVYILPGVAIDPGGHVIVMPEPAFYDMSNYREGMLHILLTYDESRPQPSNGLYGDSPYYVYTGYNVETVIDEPDSPLVELARIQRTDRTQPIHNANPGAQPGINQINLRFRPHVVTFTAQTALLGVHHLNGVVNSAHRRGCQHLAQQLSRQADMQVWVDDEIVLGGDLSQYTLLNLVAKDRFQLDMDEVNALYRYLQGGGTLFLESCHREGGPNPASDGALRDVLETLGVRMEALRPQHPLLHDPYFFAYPPLGYETQGAPDLWVGDGVIFSSFDYGCLWAGERRSGLAAREEIRSGFEWGHNLIRYALQRRANQTR